MPPANRSDSNAYPDRPPDRGAKALPLSGAEDVFSNAVYGSARGRGNNNCYAWAIDEYRNSGGNKLQPGNLSSRKGMPVNLSSCAVLRSRALADLRGRAYVGDPDKPCKAGHYKIMGFLDPHTDYHWYKQHRHVMVKLTDKMRDLATVARKLGVPPKQVYSPSPSPRLGDTVLVKDAGVWSHKQGHATGPLLKDGCDRAIRDPRGACRSYGRLDYTAFCGALCVKSRRSSRAAPARKLSR